MNYLSALNSNEMTAERIRLAVLGGLRFGKPVIVDSEDCDLFDAIQQFVNGVRPTLFDEILSNEITKGGYCLNDILYKYYLESCFKTLIKDSDDGNYQYTGSNSVNYDRYVPNFRFILYIRKDPPAQWAEKFQVVNVSN